MGTELTWRTRYATIERQAGAVDEDPWRREVHPALFHAQYQAVEWTRLQGKDLTDAVDLAVNAVSEARPNVPSPSKFYLSKEERQREQLKGGQKALDEQADRKGQLVAIMDQQHRTIESAVNGDLEEEEISRTDAKVGLGQQELQGATGITSDGTPARQDRSAEDTPVHEELGGASQQATPLSDATGVGVQLLPGTISANEASATGVLKPPPVLAPLRAPVAASTPVSQATQRTTPPISPPPPPPRSAERKQPTQPIRSPGDTSLGARVRSRVSVVPKA